VTLNMQRAPQHIFGSARPSPGRRTDGERGVCTCSTNHCQPLPQVPYRGDTAFGMTLEDRTAASLSPACLPPQRGRIAAQEERRDSPWSGSKCSQTPSQALETWHSRGKWANVLVAIRVRPRDVEAPSLQPPRCTATGTLLGADRSAHESSLSRPKLWFNCPVASASPLGDVNHT
jgi:hypothetical protein